MENVMNIAKPTITTTITTAGSGPSGWSTGICVRRGAIPSTMDSMR